MSDSRDDSDDKGCWQLGSRLYISFHRSTRVADHPDRQPITHDAVLNRSSALHLTPWRLSDGRIVYLVALNFPRNNALRQLEGLAIQVRDKTSITDIGFRLRVNVQGENVAGEGGCFFVCGKNMWIDGTEARPWSPEHPRLVRQFVVSDSVQRCPEQHETGNEQGQETLAGVIEVEVHAGYAGSLTPTGGASNRESGFAIFLIGFTEFCEGTKINEPRIEISNVQPSDTISDVKLRAAKIFGVHPDAQRLIYAGKQLIDERTVEYYGIRENDSVYMWFRLRGGGPRPPKELLPPVKIYRGGLIEQSCNAAPASCRWGDIPAGRLTVYVLGPESFQQVTGLAVPEPPTLEFAEMQALWSGSENVGAEPGLAAQASSPKSFASPISPFSTDQLKGSLVHPPSNPLSNSGNRRPQRWLKSFWGFLKCWGNIGRGRGRG